MKRKITVVFWAGLLTVYGGDKAFAYLDPGSGSMYLQILLGGVAGMGLVLKVFWSNILAMLGIGKKDAADKKPEEKNS
jgi:hypothetical protein